LNSAFITSYERDEETDLDFAQARYFNSGFGRFSSPDDFLNDAQTSDPQSWNLYIYVSNNPLNYTDPSGEEIYSTNLSDEEKKKLLEDWKKETGYKNIYFDENNKLIIDTKAGIDGGSKLAQQLLSDAATSKEMRFNLTAVDSKKVEFCDTNLTNRELDNSGKTARRDYIVQLDFKDFNNFTNSDKEAKEAFSIGLNAFHEIAHNLYGAIGDGEKKDQVNKPGPVEDKYINPIRRELGLAERVHYAGKPTPDNLKSFFPNGGSQILFRLNGKEKMLRWQRDKVGSKVQ
jgi:RHS repeat-associated protein